MWIIPAANQPTAAPVEAEKEAAPDVTTPVPDDPNEVGCAQIIKLLT